MGAFSEAFVAARLPLRGTFEAHITVTTQDAAERAEFSRACAELGVEHVGIELPEGEHRAQPMTASYHRGELAQVLAEIDALHGRLAATFQVTRVKLEATLDTEGLPTPGGYYEFHVKVRALPARLGELGELATRHAGRLSRNDRRRDDDHVQRFVTQRIYGADRAAAEATLEALLVALREAGFEVRGTAREYTVYDSRVELDRGWLEPPA